MNCQQFQTLGKDIHAGLRLRNFDERALPELALDVLGRADLDTDFQPDQLAEFFLTTHIPQQPTQQFSNLPLIVYQCDDFRIELLVWMDATTEIHQHGFSGAFRVLAGSSVHSIYEFDEHERVSSRLLLGDTRLKKVEVLCRGDVRAIHSGRRGLLHALFHLDRPSVTLVVRNATEPWAKPQYSLARPHVAFAAHELRQDSRVRLVGRLLAVAAGLNGDATVNLLVSQCARLDFPRLFMVLRENYGFLLDADADWRRFMQAARDVHGQLADHLAQMVNLAKREASIVATRSSVKDPELRFFLALLLNVPSRKWIDQIVQERYPADPPETLYCQWLKRLSHEQSLAGAFHELAEKAKLARYGFGARFRGAVPFGREDPRTDAILRAVVTGVSTQAMVAHLHETFGDSLRSSEALEAHAQLRQLAELEPLLPT